MDLHAQVDRLGPVSMQTLRELGADFAARGLLPAFPMRVTTAALCGEEPDAYAALVASGTPVCVLWRETPTYGHYVLLQLRSFVASGRPRNEIELFDPLAEEPDLYLAPARDERVRQRNDAYNADGLGRVLDRLVGGGYKLSVASSGPQAMSSKACGLWCLLRAARPDLSPSAWLREVRRG